MEKNVCFTRKVVIRATNSGLGFIFSGLVQDCVLKMEIRM